MSPSAILRAPVRHMTGVKVLSFTEGEEQKQKPIMEINTNVVNQTEG